MKNKKLENLNCIVVAQKDSSIVHKWYEANIGSSLWIPGRAYVILKGKAVTFFETEERAVLEYPNLLPYSESLFEANVIPYIAVKPKEGKAEFPRPHEVIIKKESPLYKGVSEKTFDSITSPSAQEIIDKRPDAVELLSAVEIIDKNPDGYLIFKDGMATVSKEDGKFLNDRPLDVTSEIPVKIDLEITKEEADEFNKKMEKSLSDELRRAYENDPFAPKHSAKEINDAYMKMNFKSVDTTPTPPPIKITLSKAYAIELLAKQFNVEQYELIIED